MSKWRKRQTIRLPVNEQRVQFVHENGGEVESGTFMAPEGFKFEESYIALDMTASKITGFADGKDGNDGVTVFPARVMFQGVGWWRPWPKGPGESTKHFLCPTCTRNHPSQGMPGGRTCLRNGIGFPDVAKCKGYLKGKPG